MPEEEKTMSNSEEETVAALRLLFEKVAELSAMNIRDMLTPGKYGEFKATLDTAYDSLVHIEDALDSVGMRLEYHHWRIRGAYEELKPLLLQPRIRSDTVLEALEQDLQRKHGKWYPS